MMESLFVKNLKLFFFLTGIFVLSSCGKPIKLSELKFTQNFDLVQNENESTVVLGYAYNNETEVDYNLSIKTIDFFENGSAKEGGELSIGLNPKSIESNKGNLFSLDNEKGKNKINKVIFLYEIKKRNGEIIEKSYIIKE